MKIGHTIYVIGMQIHSPPFIIIFMLDHLPSLEALAYLSV